MALHPGEQGVCYKHGTYDEYCRECANDKQVAKERTTTGYERAVEYLRSRGGGAALSALVEEGYEGDGIDYDKLVERFKRSDKAVEDLPKHIKDLQFHGQVAQSQPSYELTVFGRDLSEIKKALDYWDSQRNNCAQVPLDTMRELLYAAERLLAWQPICSLGSSGDLRQKRLRKALDSLKGVS